MGVCIKQIVLKQMDSCSFEAVGKCMFVKVDPDVCCDG